jgi:hypothetical protein
MLQDSYCVMVDLLCCLSNWIKASLRSLDQLKGGAQIVG